MIGLAMINFYKINGYKVAFCYVNLLGEKQKQHRPLSLPTFNEQYFFFQLIYGVTSSLLVASIIEKENVVPLPS